MKFAAAALAVAAAGSVLAQRPSNESICDYYTTALFTNNTAANQYTLLTALVNTAVIGNYTSNMTAVPGILAPGEFNGTQVNLAPYFSGALMSTNRGGSGGVSVNFLDGGGAAPLMNNSASNNASSNQQRLLTHLYSYFGFLLNCSTYGETGFPAYNGSNSQASVHRFMVLTPAENGYFIQQVALAAASFGVAQDDIMDVGMALDGLFNYRCSPATVVIPSQPAALQAICQDSTCPISPNQNCSAYPAPVVSPLPVGASASASASGMASSAPSAASVASAASSAVMGRW